MANTGRPLTEDRYKEIVRVVEACNGNKSEAARRLGTSNSTLRTILATAARRHGLVPSLPDLRLPAGYNLGKLTTQVDADGVVKMVWARSSPTWRALEAATDALVAKAKSKAKKPRAGAKKSRAGTKGTMLEICLADQHISRYAWKPETGEDYNSKIAVETLVAGVQTLIRRSPKADKCMLLSLGDYCHVDNRTGQTEKAKNILDYDTRYAAMLDFAVQGLKDSIELALDAMPLVEVALMPGNHDWHVTHALTRIIDAYYHLDPRVKIHITFGPRTYHRYGVNLIGIAHGDGVAVNSWPMLMATEARSLWGETEFHHWHLGHIHHGKKLVYTGFADEQGVVVEFLPSIAMPDAWHVEKGFNLSERCMHGITWHKDYGPINRSTVYGRELQGSGS